MFKNSALTTIVASGIATFAIFSNSDAEALTTWRNFAPSMCVAQSGGAQPTIASNGQPYNASSSAVSWVCPVVSDSTLQARNATKAETPIARELAPLPYHCAGPIIRAAAEHARSLRTRE
jgi:hypothetical protein